MGDQFPELAITGEDDYSRTGRVAWVFKVHGSVDWSTPIGIPNEPWAQAVVKVEYPAILRQKLYVNDVPTSNIRDYLDDGQLHRYPLLSAPLAGKSESEFLLPLDQESALADFLASCGKYLIIGISGKDGDLLRFLSDHAANPSLIHYVGKGKEAEINLIRDRFEKDIPRFKSARMNSEVYPGGFGEYIESGRQFERFWSA